MERSMQKLNDLSRSLIALEPDGTVIAVIEMSLSSWLVAGIVPGVERQPLKKLAVDESALLKLLHRYDGADIAHLILKQHAQIDWRRLLGYMDLHWEVLLVHLLNFRWAYPSERENVPRWLMDELIVRRGEFEARHARLIFKDGTLSTLI